MYLSRVIINQYTEACMEISFGAQRLLKQDICGLAQHSSSGIDKDVDDIQKRCDRLAPSAGVEENRLQEVAVA